MIRSHNPKSAFLFIVALASESMNKASGYSVGAPVSKPRSSAFPVDDTKIYPQDIQLNTFSGRTFAVSIEEMNPSFIFQTRRPSRSTYDLGLGKNAPVGQTSKGSIATSSNSGINDLHQATKYWNEYESVRAFPSPQSQESIKGAQQSLPTKKPRTSMSIKPARKAHDVLSILPDHMDVLHASVSSSSVQIDVNTIWVEMLIHSEQLKFDALTVN